MIRDVVIVGGGVVGTAIARELSRFELRCTLIEAAPDVGARTSKANTALLHTGFDAKPGTLEAKLVPRGRELLTEYAARVGIPLERAGALLVAWSEEQRDEFGAIGERAYANGYGAIREISVDELYRREPHLGPGAAGALEVPDEGMVCPFTTPLAFATEAVLGGCELRRGVRVTRIERVPEGFRIETGGETLTTRYLVNAAGQHADDLHRQLGYSNLTITPRRGELIVFDKLARPLLRHIILAVPTGTSKGVLLAPTVFGNILLGPTAQDVADKDDTSSTADGLAYLRSEARRIVPELLEHEVTAVYVGLRTASDDSDYRISVDNGYAWAAGIRSTGLTASMAIAEHLRAKLVETQPKQEVPAVRMPNIGEAAPRPFAEPERIAADPEYGRVVCFCERVTAGEIRDALTATVPAVDLDGLRRRTRVLMGRCQGFFCGAEVRSLLAEARQSTW
ncbi:MAG TPA: NAD(P)/FAD-dependent oxidoreductase [Gaiellaceae bacterium]|nr:NAD(P)/FAD-dependent oxidoreductase [Gaiellaceae bacterium]